jgi:hypothetical protein
MTLASVRTLVANHPTVSVVFREWGVVKSLGPFARGPVVLVHTQNFRLPIRKAHLGTTSDARLFSGEKRTSHFKRVTTVFDPSRKSSTPFAMTYEAATLPSGRAKLISSG